ncbi:MAG: asparagine synthase-related protein [Muribaculaceae bacterium]
MILGSFIDNIFKTDDTTQSIYTNDGLSVMFCGNVYNKHEIGFDNNESNAYIAYLLYQKGLKTLSKIDGSFTIVIKDGVTTIIVRDHHGTHSQIYYNKNSYATSLSDLCNTVGFKNDIDYSSLCSFLNIGYIATDRTAFRDVMKLAAGTALIATKGQFKSIKLFEANFTPAQSDKSLDELSEEYGALHRAAISRRIGNSQNVGILLSGGYDSGCNLAALRGIYNGEVNSYSIGFKGDNWSELPLARCMSDTFGTTHHEYEISGDEIDALPEIVKHLGDPFVEGGLMVNYCAMRMIGVHKPSIILGGDGSDQYFGTSGREIAIHCQASKYGMMPLIKGINSILNNNIFEKDNKAYRIRFQLDKIINILHGDMFGIPEFMLRNIVINDKYSLSHSSEKIDTSSFEALYTQHAIISDLEKIINQVILFKASRMAEMFGNNMAFPFMDNMLYDFLQQLPVSFKCRGENVRRISQGDSEAKFLLKYHYKPQLPTEITTKKKQGGFAPMPIFFSDEKRRRRMAEYILSSAVMGTFLCRNNVERFLHQYENDIKKGGNWFWYSQNKAIQYFNLLTLAVWWETYVNCNNSVKL